MSVSEIALLSGIHVHGNLSGIDHYIIAHFRRVLRIYFLFVKTVKSGVLTLYDHQSPVTRNQLLVAQLQVRCQFIGHRWYTVNPVLSGHSKNRQKKGFQDNCSLMKVKSIAECSLNEGQKCCRMLQEILTFIKRQSVLKTNFWSSFWVTA